MVTQAPMIGSFQDSPKTQNRSSAPTESGDGKHGLLGTGAVDGLFATYCASVDEC